MRRCTLQNRGIPRSHFCAHVRCRKDRWARGKEKRERAKERKKGKGKRKARQKCRRRDAKVTRSSFNPLLRIRINNGQGGGYKKELAMPPLQRSAVEQSEGKGIQDGTERSPRAFCFSDRWLVRLPP